MARLLILAGVDIRKKNNVRTLQLPPSFQSCCLHCDFLVLFIFCVQLGLTCCDEARADGRMEFVAFILAVQDEVTAAMQRAQGNADTLRSLVIDIFENFDARTGTAVEHRTQPQVAVERSSRKQKFSSSRASLRVKTTVELLLEEHRCTAATPAEAVEPARVAKPKSRIMFSM